MRLFLSTVFCLAAASSAQDQTRVAADRAFQARKWAEAAAAYAKVVASKPDDGAAWYRLGYAHHARGEYEQALAAHEKAAALVSPAQTSATYNAACAHALLGHTDAAIAWLEKAIARGFVDARLLATDTDLANLHTDPRFAGLRARVGAKTRTGTAKVLPPRPPGNARQFDFWVGEWDTRTWSLRPGGWAKGGLLQMKVFPILKGHAIVEYAEGRIGQGKTFGYSLRSFDPATDRWTLLLNWPGPSSPSFSSLTGGFRHGRGEFVTPEWTDAKGVKRQLRYSFSDAAPNRLRWDGAATTDGGQSWKTDLIFEFTRRAAGAQPLAIGPSRDNSRAPGAPFRSFDFMLGDWAGERQIGERRMGVEQRTVSLLGGTMLTDFTTLADGREEYAIRARNPGRKTWVRYGLTESSPRFERHEGAVADVTITLAGRAGPGSSGSPETIVWTEHAGDEIACERRRGDTVVWRQTLRRKKN